MSPREIFSEALQGQVFHFVWVDVVAEAGLLRGRDVAPVVDRWKVRHPNAHKFCGTMTSAKSQLRMASATFRYIARLRVGP